MKRIQGIFRSNWLYPIGAAIGALGGYIYYAKVGCLTGTCPLQSSPTAMIVWGAVIGAFTLSIFKKN